MSGISETWVPAWKRIGLKLKRDQPSANSSTPLVAEKRKYDYLSTTNSELSRPEGGTRANEVSIPKRKKISFTADAKDYDGAATTRIYDKWRVTQNGEPDQFTATEASKFITSKLHSANAPTTQDNARTAKFSDGLNAAKSGNKARSSTINLSTSMPKHPPKSERVKPQKPKATEPSQGDLEALKYLSEFVSSRDTWKFKKHHQIRLLRKTFDFFAIPTNYTGALVSYVRGLRGQTAKELLANACVKVLTEEGNDQDGKPPGEDKSESKTRAEEILKALGVETRRFSPDIPALKTSKQIRFDESSPSKDLPYTSPGSSQSLPSNPAKFQFGSEQSFSNSVANDINSEDATDEGSEDSSEDEDDSDSIGSLSDSESSSDESLQDTEDSHNNTLSSSEGSSTGSSP